MTERLVEEVIWDNTKVISLRKFETSTHGKIPSLVNTYGSSCPNLPSELFKNPLLLYSFIKNRKVICTRLNDDCHKFSIPVGYAGYMEVLSEDNKAVSPMRIVSEILEKKPESVLVRQPMNAISDVRDVNSVVSIEKGSILKIQGTVKITNKSNSTQQTFLHCVKSGKGVFMDVTSKGSFSPIAGPNNISGVHTMDSLLKRFRLPLTVRMVSGKIPKEACDDEKPGLFRLHELRQDNTAVLLPLSKLQKLITISVKCEIQFIRPLNMKELSRGGIFSKLLDVCASKTENYLKTMQVLVNSKPKPSRPVFMIEESRIFDEVDEIYPYIRNGGTPPKLRAHSFTNKTIDRKSLNFKVGKSQRSASQPTLASPQQKRLGSSSSTRVLRKHTVSSPVTETTIQFQSAVDNISLGKQDIIKEFIDRYNGSLSDEAYFTLERAKSDSSRPCSVKEILCSNKILCR